jgi:transcriptional regulator with XRE-family HTH domain
VEAAEARTRRKSLGWSRERLAVEANVGIKTIYNWETKGAPKLLHYLFVSYGA